MPTALAPLLTNFQLSSQLMACMLFLIAAIMHSPQRDRSTSSRSIQFACVITAILQISTSMSQADLIELQLLSIAEISYISAWVFALGSLLERSTDRQISFWLKTLFLTIALCALTFSITRFIDPSFFSSLFADNYRAAFGQLLLTLIALVLVEQVFRNSTESNRHDLKYIGIGLTALLLLDLYHYSYISVFSLKDPVLSQARGSISCLIAALFIVGALRAAPQQAFSISRSMTFYTTSILLASIFLLIMAAAGYYIQVRGGTWSGAIQVVLLVFTFISLSSVAASRSARSHIRVLVSKHFFRHKYDYRNVWLNLIKTLSQTNDEDFYLRSITAAADVFDSPGGCLWLKDKSGHFEIVAQWNIDLANADRNDNERDFNFTALMEQQEWVYAPNDRDSSTFDVNNEQLPQWIRKIEKLWIVAPLLIGQELTGFFILLKPPNSDNLIWEDLDVLKTVGRQLASYIVRQRSAEELAESKQFDTYNRLTAFIMHDLKNLIAQQALVVQNANKHKENPAFVEDAINTIDNSVQRMSHLLKRLQSSNQSAPQRSISIEKVLLESIRKSTDRQPIPTLRKGSEDLRVVADKDQLIMVIMHVIRNAQDATENSGFIDVVLECKDDFVLIEIEDNGHGMDEEFLKNRLFKPFESTKSSMGMGIGAYQVREFIQNLGGNIAVSSEVDVGTTVCIELPISQH